jgi:hypothetical protein
MDATNALRYRIIKNVMAQHDEQDAVLAIINLWERLAIQIISIVGESGFYSLYTRSVLIAKTHIPWLEAATLLLQPDARFAELKRSFEKQPLAQVIKGNNLLMITFTDILATIIGEQLTVSILRAAWGDEITKGGEK